MQVVIGLNTGVGIFNRFAQSLSTELSSSKRNRVSKDPTVVDAPIPGVNRDCRRWQVRFLPSELLTLNVETLVDLIRHAGHASDRVAAFTRATNGREEPKVLSLRVLQVVAY